MTSNETVSAGGRKYLLIHPETFSLLVENFQEPQKIRQDPNVKLAFSLQKSFGQLRQMSERGKVDRFEMKKLVNSVLLQHCEKVVQLYKVGEYCARQNEGKPAEDNQQELPPITTSPAIGDISTTTSVAPVKKKQKPNHAWISIDQFRE